MKKTILLSVASVVILSGCNQATSTNQEQTSAMPHNPMCNNEAMPGGWHPPGHVSPEVEKAVALVLRQITTSSPLKKITDVRTQVVAGMNYAVEFELENGEVWNAIIYQSLNNEYSITQEPKLGKICS
ncbi:cystatin domain-containing protein [Vibrio sp. VPAP30]|uniref:cystatin domain-containing protein n=1 Tax=Vibrio sp. VPAP30 TaxID=1647102 RepID=UPI0006581754|nr:cystatin domain-containing protein [Vibrio sp. VPAP30]KLN63520.1 2-oxoglutarate dehydrogenase [Vibrio sp. VPAP30]